MAGYCPCVVNVWVDLVTCFRWLCLLLTWDLHIGIVERRPLIQRNSKGKLSVVQSKYIRDMFVFVILLCMCIRSCLVESHPYSFFVESVLYVRDRLGRSTMNKTKIPTVTAQLIPSVVAIPLRDILLPSERYLSISCRVSIDRHRHMSTSGKSKNTKEKKEEEQTKIMVWQRNFFLACV